MILKHFLIFKGYNTILYTCAEYSVQIYVTGNYEVGLP